MDLVVRSDTLQLVVRFGGLNMKGTSDLASARRSVIY